jgi:hypothetical protein
MRRQLTICYPLGGSFSWRGRSTSRPTTLTRRLGARGSEAYALSLTADIAAASGAENAEGYHRAGLALAEPRGMRPQVAHCHFGLGRLHRRRGDREQALEDLTTALTMYREMGMTSWPEQAEAELCQLG